MMGATKRNPVAEQPFTAEDRLNLVKAVFDMHLHYHETFVEKFKTRVSADEINSALWNVEDVIKSTRMLPNLRVWRSICMTGLAPHGHPQSTVGWQGRVNAVLKKIADETRKCVEQDDYRHNCTSEIANIENQCQFWARQELVKILTEVLGVMNKPVEE